MFIYLQKPDDRLSCTTPEAFFLKNPNQIPIGLFASTNKFEYGYLTKITDKNGNAQYILCKIQRIDEKNESIEIEGQSASRHIEFFQYNANTQVWEMPDHVIQGEEKNKLVENIMKDARIKNFFKDGNFKNLQELNALLQKTTETQLNFDVVNFASVLYQMNTANILNNGSFKNLKGDDTNYLGFLSVVLYKLNQASITITPQQFNEKIANLNTESLKNLVSQLEMCDERLTQLKGKDYEFLTHLFVILDSLNKISVEITPERLEKICSLNADSLEAFVYLIQTNIDFLTRLRNEGSFFKSAEDCVDMFILFCNTQIKLTNKIVDAVVNHRDSFSLHFLYMTFEILHKANIALTDKIVDVVVKHHDPRSLATTFKELYSANIALTDKIVDAVVNCNEDSPLSRAFRVLLHRCMNALTDNPFRDKIVDAIVNCSDPELLAGAFNMLYSANIVFTDKIVDVVVKHHDPRSLATTFKELYSANIALTDKIVDAVAKHRDPFFLDQAFARLPLYSANIVFTDKIVNAVVNHSDSPDNAYRVLYSAYIVLTDKMVDAIDSLENAFKILRNANSALLKSSAYIECERNLIVEAVVNHSDPASLANALVNLHKKNVEQTNGWCRMFFCAIDWQDDFLTQYLRVRYKELGGGMLAERDIFKDKTCYKTAITRLQAHFQKHHEKYEKKGTPEKIKDNVSYKLLAEFGRLPQQEPPAPSASASATTIASAVVGEYEQLKQNAGFWSRSGMTTSSGVIIAALKAFAETGDESKLREAQNKKPSDRLKKILEQRSLLNEAGHLDIQKFAVSNSGFRQNSLVIN